MAVAACVCGVALIALAGSFLAAGMGPAEDAKAGVIGDAKPALEFCSLGAFAFAVCADQRRRARDLFAGVVIAIAIIAVGRAWMAFLAAFPGVWIKDVAVFADAFAPDCGNCVLVVAVVATDLLAVVPDRGLTFRAGDLRWRIEAWWRVNGLLDALAVFANLTFRAKVDA